jgi:membrane protein YqaA with SNARE-associated domain
MILVIGSFLSRFYTNDRFLIRLLPKMKDSLLFIMPFVQDTFLSFDSSLNLAVMSMLKTVMDGKHHKKDTKTTKLKLLFVCML